MGNDLSIVKVSLGRRIFLLVTSLDRENLSLETTSTMPLARFVRLIAPCMALPDLKSKVTSLMLIESYVSVNLT